MRSKVLLWFLIFVPPFALAKGIDVSKGLPQKSSTLEKNLPVKQDVPIKTAIPVKSLQRFSVSNNAEVLGTISNIESNRITLVGDRISSVVNSDMQSYRIKNNTLTGDIFLLPNGKVTKPQNLFVSSEKGFTYKLVLVPNTLPAQQIVLRDVKASKRSWSKNYSQYYSYIADRIKQLAVRPFSWGVKVLFKQTMPTFTLKLLEQYNDGALVFYRGILVNTSAKKITLDKSSIRFSSRRALWLETDVLLPHEQTSFVLALERNSL